MKKLISILVSSVLVMGVITVPFAEEKPISITMDNNEVALPYGAPYATPYGRTMVPIRFVSENLGCKVKWETGDIVDVLNDKIRIVFTVGDYTARVTDLKANVTQLMVSDVRPVWKEGEVMVPLRFISEVLGNTVDWDGELNQVGITLSKKDTGPSQPVFSNGICTAVKSTGLLNHKEKPFEIEYLDVTKEEVGNEPVLKSLSQLPNCTSISKRDSTTTWLSKYRFTFQEINTNNDSYLNPVFYFDVNSDFSGMSFWVERNNNLTLDLLKSTLAILFKDDRGAQDTIYQQVLKQKTAPAPILNKSLINYKLFTEKTATSNWKEEAFNVGGTVYRLR